MKILKNVATQLNFLVYILKTVKIVDFRGNSCLKILHFILLLCIS